MPDTKISAATATTTLPQTASYPVALVGDTTARRITHATLRGGVFNVRDYGAVGNGIANDTAAIQAAITAANGGYVLFQPGTYIITAVLTAATPVALVGLNRQTTIIQQQTAGQDILSLGAADVNGVGWIVNGLTLSGGRYGLRCNNVLQGKFSDLYFLSNTSGIYLEGQIEACSFERLNLSAFASFGITGGNVNGGSNPSYNFPIVQKCRFEHIVFTGASGSTSIKIVAGVYLAVQTTSGANIFRDIVSQGAETRVLELSYAFNTLVERLTNESSTLPAANTYTVIMIGNSCSLVTITDCYLAGRANDGTTWKYVIDNQGCFFLTIRNTLITVGAAGTNDIRLAVGALLSNVALAGGVATGLAFSSDASKRRSLLLGVLGGNGEVLRTWANDIPWLGADAASGLQAGNLTAYVNSPDGSLLTGANYIIESGTLEHIIPKAAGKRFRIRRDTDNFPILDVLTDPAEVLVPSPTRFTAVLGLGIGNSAAATTLGSVVKKMEVFDAAGASLGFVPIYGSIT